MARNMFGVDQDNETVQRIASESGAYAGFVVAMIEFYSDGPLNNGGWELDGRDGTVGGAIVRNTMVAAFAYDEQDDDEDEEQTRMLRDWAYGVAQVGIESYIGK